MSTIALQPARIPSARVQTVRLTRRGRAVVLGLALLAVLALGLLLTPGSSATKEAEATETVLVGQGDTLWGIAKQVAAPGETADMVDHIKELNHLDSGMVVAGQELRVPVS